MDDSVAESSLIVVANVRETPEVFTIGRTRTSNGGTNPYDCRQRDLLNFTAMTVEAGGCLVNNDS